MAELLASTLNGEQPFEAGLLGVATTLPGVAERA
jgi:hypothetical protein